MNRWLAATLFTVTAFMAVPVRADGPYEGQWREGPMNIRVTVQSWGGDCGPRPQSTTTRGGGAFGITQSGDHLTFRLRRQRSTRTCWSENRHVRRVSSNVSSGTWTIVCRTPQADSRAETGHYTIQAIGADRLQFTDRSEYDWQLNESSCRATIRTTQSFTRVSGGAATPEPTTPRERCTPGDAARIALRPATADIQPGGEQCFTARLVDASGCPLRGRRPTLRLGPGSSGSVSGLCYRAADTSGTGTVVASQGSIQAEARITVRTMDLSDLIARRTETGSVGSGPPEEDATSQTAARVSTRETDEEPDLVLPSIAVGGALLLVLFGVLVLRSRARSKTSVVKDVPMVRRAGSVRPPPGATLAGPAPETESAPEPPGEAGEDLICPTCRRGYSPGTKTCLEDGTALMPYSEFAAAGQDESNVCPTCGKRFATNRKFCGEDGATLVPWEG